MHRFGDDSLWSEVFSVHGGVFNEKCLSQDVLLALTKTIIIYLLS